MFVVFMSDLILFEIFPHGRGISHTASSPHGSPSHPYSKKNYVSPIGNSRSNKLYNENNIVRRVGWLF